MTVHRRWASVPVALLLRVAFAVVVLGAAAPTGSPAPATPASVLSAARERLVDHFSTVEERCRCASALQQRFDAESAQLAHPADDSAADHPDAAVLAQLEAQLVDHLIASPATAQPVDGAQSLLIRSHADGTWQPLAVFAPASSKGKNGLPLVILLPDAQQSENEVIALPQLRALAQSTQTVLAVPWMRGTDTLSQANSADVYDARDALTSSYAIDQRRIFLGGISIGAINAFSVATQKPRTWSALLSIGGTLTTDTMAAVGQYLRGKQFFLVAGGDDHFIRAEYVRAAASWLSQNGMESHYYEAARGDRTFTSMESAVEQAWHAMLSGVRATTSGGETELRTPAPLPSQKG